MAPDPHDPRERALDTAYAGLQRALDQGDEVARLSSSLVQQAKNNNFAQMVIDTMRPKGTR